MYHIVSVLKTQALKPVCPPLYNILNTITKQFWLELLFPVPVITHLKLQYTSWLLQNLSKLFLKLLTELELTTCTGKLFMVWIVHGMKSSNSPGTQLAVCCRVQIERQLQVLCVYIQITLAHLQQQKNHTFPTATNWQSDKITTKHT